MRGGAAPARNKKKWQPTLLQAKSDILPQRQPVGPSRGVGRGNIQYGNRRQNGIESPFDDYDDDGCETVIAACCCCLSEIRDFLGCAHSPTSYCLLIIILIGSVTWNVGLFSFLHRGRTEQRNPFSIVVTDSPALSRDRLRCMNLESLWKAHDASSPDAQPKTDSEMLLWTSLHCEALLKETDALGADVPNFEDKNDPTSLFCNDLKKKYFVNPGRSWGNLPSSMQDVWRSKHCDCFTDLGCDLSEAGLLRKGGFGAYRRAPIKIPYSITAEGIWEATRVREPVQLQKPTAPVIAVLVAATSHGFRWVRITQLPLVQYLLPSVGRTVESGFHYRVYVGYDIGDLYFDKAEHVEEVAEWFQAAVQQPCHARGITVELLPQPFHNTKKKPGPVFNFLSASAFGDGADYVYRVNDDSEFRTGWASAYTKQLAEFSPPNIGVVGPTCKEGNSRILTHDFVHKSHMYIFGVHYPPVLMDWWMDDWISSVYGQTNTRRMTKVLVVHHISSTSRGEVPVRYDIDYRHREHLSPEVDQGKAAISAFISDHCKGLFGSTQRCDMPSSFPHSQPSSNISHILPPHLYPRGEEGAVQEEEEEEAAAVGVEVGGLTRAQDDGVGSSRMRVEAEVLKAFSHDEVASMRYKREDEERGVVVGGDEGLVDSDLGGLAAERCQCTFNCVHFMQREELPKMEARVAQLGMTQRVNSSGDGLLASFNLQIPNPVPAASMAAGSSGVTVPHKACCMRCQRQRGRCHLYDFDSPTQQCSLWALPSIMAESRLVCNRCAPPKTQTGAGDGPGRKGGGVIGEEAVVKKEGAVMRVQEQEEDSVGVAGSLSLDPCGVDQDLSGLGIVNQRALCFKFNEAVRGSKSLSMTREQLRAFLRAERVSGAEFDRFFMLLDTNISGGVDVIEMLHGVRMVQQGELSGAEPAVKTKTNSNPPRLKPVGPTVHGTGGDSVRGKQSSAGGGGTTRVRSGQAMLAGDAGGGLPRAESSGPVLQMGEKRGGDESDVGRTPEGAEATAKFPNISGGGSNSSTGRGVVAERRGGGGNGSVDIEQRRVELASSNLISQPLPLLLTNSGGAGQHGNASRHWVGGRARHGGANETTGAVPAHQAGIARVFGLNGGGGAPAMADAGRLKDPPHGNGTASGNGLRHGGRGEPEGAVRTADGYLTGDRGNSSS